MKSSFYLRLFYIMSIIWLGIVELFAQPGDVPGGDGSSGVPVGGDAGVPLDGGIISLLLAGLGILVIRKIRRKKVQ